MGGVSKGIRILLSQVEESDQELIASCHRLLESLIAGQVDETAELIYRLGESLQDGDDESLPSTEEVFRANCPREHSQVFIKLNIKLTHPIIKSVPPIGVNIPTQRCSVAIKI